MSRVHSSGLSLQQLVPLEVINVGVDFSFPIPFLMTMFLSLLVIPSALGSERATGRCLLEKVLRLSKPGDWPVGRV